MISIGIIGCGAVTHLNYGPVLVGRSDYRVAHVFDLSAEQAASAARLFGAEVTPVERLVEESDFVVVATPPATHLPLVLECVQPGKAILCEKPFMLTAADAAVALSATEARAARLYVGHHRRTYPQVELARNLIQLGVIGAVTGFTAREGGRSTWQAVSNYLMRDARGGGVMWDTGSHTLDMALFAAGLDELPDPQVDVREVYRDQPEPSHHFRARFELRSGDQAVEGNVELSRVESLPNVVAIRGERGEIHFVTNVDSRVRVTTQGESSVLFAERSHVKFDSVASQFTRVVLQERDEDFAARRFLGQVKILEAITGG